MVIDDEDNMIEIMHAKKKILSDNFIVNNLSKTFLHRAGKNKEKTGAASEGNGAAHTVAALNTEAGFAPTRSRGMGTPRTTVMLFRGSVPTVSHAAGTYERRMTHDRGRKTVK